MERVSVKKENLVRTYQNADSATKKVLERLFKNKCLIDNSIIDKVKTFNDVLKAVDISSSDARWVLEYDGREGEEMGDVDMIRLQAYFKIVLIARVLNDGWKPKSFDLNQNKYIPIITDWHQSSISFMDCTNMIQNNIINSDICYKSPDLAKYAATQFFDIYLDFLTKK